MAMIPPTPEFMVLIREYNPIHKITKPDFEEVFGQYGEAVLNQFNRYFKAKNSRDPVDRLGTFYKEIDSELASINDVGIQSGWINFFKTESQRVRDNTIKKIGTPQFLNRSFPPKLNHVTSMENTYSNNVKPPVIDPKPKVPHLVSTGMDLPGYISVNLVYAGQVLGEIFNSNIAAIADTAVKNVDAHLGNLVPDQLHPQRIMAAATKFTENALGFFGGAAGFMAKNLGFNKYGIQNKNMSTVNYKIDSTHTEGQTIKSESTGQPYVRDVPKIEKYKPSKTV